MTEQFQPTRPYAPSSTTEQFESSPPTEPFEPSPPTQPFEPFQPTQQFPPPIGETGPQFGTGDPAHGTQPQQPLVLAGWWVRVGGLLIDGLAVGLLSGVVFAAIAVASRHFWIYLLAPLPAFPYALLMTRSGQHNGQTLGMQAVGIRVSCEDGLPVDWKVVAMREWMAKQILFGYGSLLLLPWVLNYFWPLWDSGNQALHDKIALTRVVRV